MSSKSSDSCVSKSAKSAAGLKPSYIHEIVGVYLNITCGSVTGVSI